MPSTSIGPPLRSLFLLAIALLACRPAEAAQRVVVSPVHTGRDIVTAELVLELEEAVRAGVMNAAPDLDLRVMSHATFQRSLQEAKQQGRTEQVTLPCASPACDGAVARILGTEIVVSARLAKVDDRYLLLLKLMRSADDAVLASTTLDDDSFGPLLARTSGESEKLARAGITRRALPAPESSQAPRPVDRIYRAGVLFVSDGRPFGGAWSRCELHQDRIVCTPTGLLRSGQVLTIAFADITSIYPEGAIINVASTRGTWRFWKVNQLQNDQSATRRARENEAAVNAQEMQLWFDDLRAAWSTFRGR